jgi:hypothetical protein|tara:strand:+ start:777 stop:1076 length:300 start_codon:yes stop_codon:yes gene_type:complete
MNEELIKSKELIKEQLSMIESMSAKAAEFRDQIETLLIESKTLSQTIEYQEGELKEREYSLRMKDNDCSDRILGMQKIIEQTRENGIRAYEQAQAFFQY